jgi:hypothetical protein
MSQAAVRKINPEVVAAMSSSKAIESTDGAGAMTVTVTDGLADRVIHDPFGSVIAAVGACSTAFAFVIGGMWAVHSFVGGLYL